MGEADILVISSAAEMRAWSREARRQGKTIGFVPTMGNLHEGHLSLVRAALARCDVAVASVYVNPTQFAAHEDFGVYPRTAAEDVAALARAGAAAVFAPRSLYHSPADDGAMVVGAGAGGGPAAAAGEAAGAGGGAAGDESADAHETWVVPGRLAAGLCAASRPHFFRGVATVVAKLFNIVAPDAAFFGKKDYQQWRVVERMARDLDFGVDIVGVPIVREADGLAMSSRNGLLPPAARAAAPCIAAALRAAAADAAAAPPPGADAGALAARVRAAVEAGGGRVDYVEVVHARTLRPAAAAGGGAEPVVVAVAADFGGVRLIDNIEVQ